MKSLNAMIIMGLASMLVLVSPARAQDSGIADFFQNLFGDKKDDARRPAREAGTDGGDLLYGEQAEVRLQESIRKYENIAKAGGWPIIENGPPLKLGAIDARIPAIRHRLSITGDLPVKKITQSTEFDQAMHDAVVRYQTRNGLPNKGFLGKRTISALNVKPESRLSQLRTNLARIRQMAAMTNSPRAVVINIPGYELQAIENGVAVLSSRVVVGRTDRPSPELDAVVVAVNILPKWRVPNSIATRDMLPKLKSEPEYFARENFRILRQSDGTEIAPEIVSSNTLDGSDIRIEQAPGPNNALGLIRLDMPNAHNVYLHDTPLKSLFDREARPFSSGCVRVQKVNQLAVWLLKSQTDWSSDKLARTIVAGIPQTIKLVAPVPVHFVYLTSWVEPDGDVNFREDIYKKDDASALAQSYNERKLPEQPFAP